MTKPGFESFKDECVAHLSALQEEFLKRYDINSYQHWFYDHAIGAFHFNSDQGKSLYLQYVDVGSFSTKTNTWLWSWGNKATPRHVSQGLQRVKVFGEENGLDDLSRPLVENGDEYTGWALTAITAKILDAIGSYRIPHEHQFIYFIFTHQLTQGQYDALKDKYVECDVHGSGRLAFVCQHLLTGANLGFNESFESNLFMETDDDYEAMCDECQNAWQLEGEWTENLKRLVNLKILCDQCYFESKRRNQHD